MTFELCPGTNVANCDLNTITQSKLSKSDRNSQIGLSSLGARLRSKISLVRLTFSRWRPIKEKWCAPICTICHNSGNNGRNYTNCGAQGNLQAPFELSYFDVDVTSRGLSVTFSVFQKLWRKWTLAQKLF